MVRGEARQAARELPPSRVLAIDPDQEAAARILAPARAQGRAALDRAESLALLACYGLPSGTPPGPAATIRMHDDATFGPAIAFAVLPDGAAAYDLPPLNLPLAHALAARAGLQDPTLTAAAADALVRVSQLLVDEPAIAALGVDRLVLGQDGRAQAGDAVIRLHPAGQRATLAISPYPEELAHDWSSHGQDFRIRPIRPEDAAAHAAMVRRIPPEDLRYRFFSAIRQVAPEQMARLTQIDYDREMAFLAVRPADQASVGVARLVCEAVGGAGEFAIVVEPDCKGLGLARHLLDCLIAWARARGVPEITGHILADNQPMLGFVRHLGFGLRHLPDEGDVLQAVLPLA